MSLQSKFESLFDAMPDTLPANMTFMEIAGFPHYENVCSNVLRFYFNPKTKLHGLEDLLLKSLLKAVGKYEHPFTNAETLRVKREVVTDTGRIDLVLYTDKWAIGIENKIRHHLNNDLKEYASFLGKEFPGKEIIKIVLSLKDETQNLKGGFVNLTYKVFIENIEKNLESYSGDLNDKYFLFFTNFLQTIKNLYMPVTMDRNEIEFLLNNQDKIEQLIQMEDKLNAYINQKANAISNEIKVGDGYKKWVYAGNDPGFHYTYKDLQFKLECPISKEGISIVICVEQNKADRENLKRLDLFKKRGIDNYENNSDNSRVVLEQLDFFTPTDVLVEKLKDYLSDLKITEANEQLN